MSDKTQKLIKEFLSNNEEVNSLDANGKIKIIEKFYDGYVEEARKIIFCMLKDCIGEAWAIRIVIKPIKSETVCSATTINRAVVSGYYPIKLELTEFDMKNPTHKFMYRSEMGETYHCSSFLTNRKLNEWKNNERVDCYSSIINSIFVNKELCEKCCEYLGECL